MDTEIHDDKTFEILLENGLTIKLQSFSLETRKEWIKRLQSLIQYWKLRLMQDITTIQEMRQRNLKTIGVDRGNESGYADWIQKYQLIDSVSDPSIYHFCRISDCRTISVFVN